jgi:hypothetical protein
MRKMHPVDAENKFAPLLRLLHEEIRAGRGDGEEADAIRDRMDLPWYSMTAEGQDRAGALSVRLYEEDAKAS